MAAKKPKNDSPPPSITESSGNVFADLGLPNPEQELMKAGLTLRIYRVIRERGLTQAQAANRASFAQRAWRNVRDDWIGGE